METYREAIQKRVYVYKIYCCVLLLVNVSMNIFFQGNQFTAFISGLAIAIQLVVVFKIGLYCRALKDEKVLKTVHIKECDERRQFIKTKSQSTGLLISLLAMVIAMIVSSFLSTLIFVTLLATCLLACIITLLCKAYYSRHI